MKPRVNMVACVGLALGAVFGMAGAIAPQANVRNVCWAIDAMGLIAATSLLTLKYFRKGCDFVAAGFLIFAIGETVMLSGTAADLQASIPAFAAGTACWAVGIAFVSSPREFAAPVRMIGFAASVLFAIISARIFWGEPLTPLASPLPFFAYPFLVLTFIGWIWSLAREKS